MGGFDSETDHLNFADLGLDNHSVSVGKGSGRGEKRRAQGERGSFAPLIIIIIVIIVIVHFHFFSGVALTKVGNLTCTSFIFALMRVQ